MAARPKRKTAELAEALGCHPRTLERYFDDGAPNPKRGESVADWAKRIRKWKRDRKRKPGPPSLIEGSGEEAASEAATWEVKSRKALAETRIFDLEVKRGDYLNREDVLHEWVAREMAVRTALLALPRKLARRLFQAPDPESIEEEIRAEVVAILEGFCRG